MNYDNTKYLFDKYPQLFCPENRNGSLMRFGFSHDDGWFDIIKELCEKLGCFNDLEITQVKEKFGMLRIYYQFTDLKSFTEESKETVSKLISTAENESSHICEQCAKKGKLREDLPWIKTLCSKHHKERKSRIIDYSSEKYRAEYKSMMDEGNKTNNYIMELIKSRTV